ncbi:MAG TPA: hypothetical protein VK625_23420, partial [Flavitalea sp.]|nr:hypothetical protein [Flavitalea sp.]
MNKIYVYVFLILSSSFSASCGYAQVEKYIGTWEGIINVGAKIRFVLNISEDGKKGLKTIAESPDQTSTKIPCDSTIVDDSGITVNISIAKASYHGKLINDTTLEGTF